MNKYIVTFDKSNEDIPTLIVGREQSYFALSPTIDIVKIITGNDAVRIWNELSGKQEKEDKG